MVKSSVQRMGRTLGLIALVASMLLSVVVLTVPNNASAASPEVWSPTSGELASTDANWADNSKPVAGSTVVFDSTSNVNCTWDLAITVGKFYMNASYTNFVTTTVNFGCTMMEINSGTLVADAKTITCGTTWNALYGNFTEGTSTVVLGGAGDIYMKAGENFWNLNKASTGNVLMRTDITVLRNMTASAGTFRGVDVNSINNKILYLYGNCSGGLFGTQRYTRIYSYYAGASLWYTSTATTLSEFKAYANCSIGKTESYRFYVAPDVTVKLHNHQNFEYFYTYFSYLDNDGLITVDGTPPISAIFECSLFEYTPGTPLVWGNVTGFSMFIIGYPVAVGGYPSRTWYLGQDFNMSNCGLVIRSLPAYAFTLYGNGYSITARYLSFDDKGSLVQGSGEITVTEGGIACSQSNAGVSATLTQGADINLAGDFYCYGSKSGFKVIQDSHNITISGNLDLKTGIFQKGTGNITLIGAGKTLGMNSTRGDGITNLNIEGSYTLISNVWVSDTLNITGSLMAGAYKMNSSSSASIPLQTGSFDSLYLNGTATSYSVPFEDSFTGRIYSKVNTTFADLNNNVTILASPPTGKYGGMRVAKLDYPTVSPNCEVQVSYVLTSPGVVNFTVQTVPNWYSDIYVGGTHYTKVQANETGALTWNYSSWSTEWFNLTSTPYNSTPIEVILQDNAYNYTVNTSVTPNTWSFTTNRSLLSFGASNHTVYGDPTNYYSNTNSSASILTTYAGGLVAYQNWSLYVVNLAPNITSTPLTTAVAGSNYLYDFNCYELGFGGVLSITTNYIGVYSFSAGSGMLSMAAMTPGTYWFNMTFNDMSGVANATTYQNWSVKASSPSWTQPLEVAFDFTVSGSSVTFEDLSVGPVAIWWWDFGDGTTSMLQNPTHEYTSPGKYKVTLTVTAADGKSDSIEKTVTIRGEASMQLSFIVMMALILASLVVMVVTKNKFIILGGAIVMFALIVLWLTGSFPALSIQIWEWFGAS